MYKLHKNLMIFLLVECAVCILKLLDSYNCKSHVIACKLIRCYSDTIVSLIPNLMYSCTCL